MAGKAKKPDYQVEDLNAMPSWKFRRRAVFGSLIFAAAVVFIFPVFARVNKSLIVVINFSPALGIGLATGSSGNAGTIFDFPKSIKMYFKYN